MSTNSLDIIHQIKDNLTCAKLAILDKCLIDELRGGKSNACATYFQGSFMNDDDLISHALAENNMNLLEYIYLQRFFLVRGCFLSRFFHSPTFLVANNFFSYLFCCRHFGQMIGTMQKLTREPRYLCHRRIDQSFSQYILLSSAV